MKLLAKYNRVNIPITITTLLVSSVGYYFIIHFTLVHQLDKDLRIEQQEIIHYINENGALPEASNYKDQQVDFRPSAKEQLKTHFSTEDIYNKKEDETESFRELEFLVTVNGSNYIAEVRKSQQETEDIVQLILLITLSVIVVLLLILFVTNRFLLGKLWKPFYNTLEQLKQFEISSKNILILHPTDVDEFKELNNTALAMTQKVINDYKALKSFTENASHEIQTPLAIIKNKMELLSQSESLDETQIKVIQSINDAASRLSRLNQSLLLLAKIENRQFEKSEIINMSFTLHRYVEDFKELAEIKNIRIEKNISDGIFIEMNESLAEILISNIIINAIKHNYPGGDIKIELDANALMVSNPGNVPKINTSELFERFKKDSTSDESIGLGLSIVKTICDSYEFDVSYDFAEGRHIMKIDFLPD